MIPQIDCNGVSCCNREVVKEAISDDAAEKWYFAFELVSNADYPVSCEEENNRIENEREYSSAGENSRKSQSTLRRPEEDWNLRAHRMKTIFPE